MSGHTQETSDRDLVEQLIGEALPFDKKKEIKSIGITTRDENHVLLREVDGRQIRIHFKNRGFAAKIPILWDTDRNSHVIYDDGTTALLSQPFNVNN